MQGKQSQPTNAFFVRIIEAHPPHQFKILHLELCKGRTDLADHNTYFELMTLLLDLDDTIKCRLFFTILGGSHVLQ